MIAPTTVDLLTADGVALVGHHLPGPLEAGSVGVLVGHGVTGSWRRPAVQEVARRLTAAGGVLVVDQRGHGLSAGLSTVGDKEVLDVDAGVGWLRAHGYERIVTVGWSMSAASVLRHAALVGAEVHGHPVRHDVDAVVHVSGTSRWLVRESPRSRWLMVMLRDRVLGHAVARGLGVRLDRTGWREWPMQPVEAAAHLGVRWLTGDRPVPLLLVHGDRDGYFGLVHPRTLAAAAGEAATVWLEPGFGHAEGSAVSHPDLLDRLAAELPRLLDRVAA